MTNEMDRVGTMVTADLVKRVQVQLHDGRLLVFESIVEAFKQLYEADREGCYSISNVVTGLQARHWLRLNGVDDVD